MRADDSAAPHPDDTNANTVQPENPFRGIPAPRAGEVEDRAGSGAIGVRFTSPNEAPYGEALELLRHAAAEIAEVAGKIRETSVRATAALTDGAVASATFRAPRAGLNAQRSLIRALTNHAGLGFAPAGGRLGTPAARLGEMIGQESLAVLILVTSLRLRIAALTLAHPELTKDPLLRHLIEAVNADRDLEAMRALRALFKQRGAAKALSGIAPVFAEITSLKALLDENPLNDAAAWAIATGKAQPPADPVTGFPNRVIALLDRGAGAARPIELDPCEAHKIRNEGSLIAFLDNIRVVGSTGRMLIQSVSGPDGVTRYAVQAPGMQVGRPRNDSPQDLVGAFRSTLLDDSPYTGAIIKAIEHFEVPEGAEIALIGHSAGGAAIMNVAQNAEFCRRYKVTHVVAVGSPIDFKTPADPRTWVSSITNRHDLIPSLDGQGAGNCFDLHPDWCVVDYTDPTHDFPACHGIEHYLANIENDLPEAREYIDDRLTPYHGSATRSQAYRLLDRAMPPDGFPFLTVPANPTTTTEGPVSLPIRCYQGSAVVSLFTADADAAAHSLAETFIGRTIRIGSRVLVAVAGFEYLRTSIGPYREVSVSIFVHDPWNHHPLKVWTELMRRPDLRRSGSYVIDLPVTSAKADDAGREIWGYPMFVTPIDVHLGRRGLAVTVHDPDQGSPIMTLEGHFGPGLPSPPMELVRYSQLGTETLRTLVHAKGAARTHLASRARLIVGASSHPMTQRLRDLGLDGARPFAVMSAPAYQARLGAGVSVLTH
jgi:hypothetical protein